MEARGSAGSSEFPGSLGWDYFSGFIFIQGNIGKEVMAGRLLSQSTVLGLELPSEGSSGHARVGLCTSVWKRVAGVKF